MLRFAKNCGLLLFAMLVCGIQENRAADFRVENRVYAQGKKEPQSRSLTVFREGIVYDFLQDPSEVIILDKSAGRFTLLSEAKEEQTEIPVAEVAAFTEKLKQVAQKHNDPVSSFYAAPKFEERFNAEKGELLLTSPWVTYRVLGEVAKDPAVLAQYREFSDDYAQLNAMLNPGSRPPTVRIQVNEALARHKVLAREVNLTMTVAKNDSSQKMYLRSEHDFAERLSSSDLGEVQKAHEAKAKFKVVNFGKYEKDRMPEH